MKTQSTSKRATWVITVCLLAIGTNAHAGAKKRRDTDLPPPAPMAPASPDAVILNPTTLKDYILKRDLLVQGALDQMYLAKADLGQARMNVLPSVNPSALLASSFSPNFLLTSVKVLLPFILPQTWFDLASAKYDYKAEQEAYRLAQLNEFASAYSLYYSMLADFQTRTALYQQYQDLKDLEDYLTHKRDDMGLATDQDVDQAAGDAAAALTIALRADELCATDEIDLRVFLNLPIDQKIQLDAVALAPSDSEKKPVREVFQKAYDIAPEVKQFNDEWHSSRSQIGSAMFGWLSDISLNSTTTSSGQATFKRTTIQGSASIGGALFYKVRYADITVDVVENQLELYSQQEAKQISAALVSIDKALQEVTSTQREEDKQTAAYNILHEKFLNNQAVLKDVLDQHAKVTKAIAESIAAQLHRDLTRIMLHRSLLTDQFSTIDGTEYQDTQLGSQSKKAEDKSESKSAPVKPIRSPRGSSN